MKILYSGLKYDYGIKHKGYSFEHMNFYETLNNMKEIQKLDYIATDEKDLSFFQKCARKFAFLAATINVVVATISIRFRKNLWSEAFTPGMTLMDAISLSSTWLVG